MCATLKTIHLALSPKLKPHATKISGTGNRSKHSFVHPSLGSLYPYRKYTPARPAQDHQILTRYGAQRSADAEGNSTTKAPVDISDLSLSVHPTSSFTFLYSHLPLPLVIVSCSTAHTHTHTPNTWRACTCRPAKRAEKMARRQRLAGGQPSLGQQELLPRRYEANFCDT